MKKSFMICRIKDYLKTLPQYVSAAQKCGQLWTSDVITRRCVKRICTYCYIWSY